ncbi:TPA: helicase RepA family protein [Klebsiella quasipneumoniae]|jgi:hypothetical protein|uniref:helicase RepA family protein n=1 Tax=Klebsiella TaxID=570 RepID=UPI000DC795C8|nr:MULTISPECIES: helicase RepA family protein [Klebsiella]HCI6822381.1 AAA family ATPase [Klebsiella variicola subsp. variicola]HDE1021139.1 AAA family ATPase [Klebsiella quasipneumoniae]AWX77830.1 hypothetical protein DQB70_17015 [Klebsiella variicola]EIW8600779.1 AAA family ATPase [Klebsiella pneumoniae]EKF7341247.1 AAA family ATPase [Klebsiella pneumoniae]
MTVQVEAVETVSDALFTCSYLWAHGKQYSRSDLDKALHQHKDPTTRYGKLVARFNQIAAMPYEELCNAGYLDIDRKKMITARRSVLVEEIGEEAMNTLLSDVQRIHRVFPKSGTTFRTKLPLTRGSEGFDVRQDYIVKHFLPAQSLCSIYGPSGSYKSFLAVSWACHIAAGRSWAGKKVTPGAVMYVVGEGGVGVPRRIKAWEQVHNDKADNLWLVNRPVFPVRESEVTEVILAARQIESECGVPVRMVVIDTLARCFGGNDENDARDMGAFIEGCDVIKQKTGATVLVVHHSGKDEAKGARGSSSFRAALDTEFNVKREGDGKALILTCTKMKDAEEPERKAYDLTTAELYTDDDGELVCSLVIHDKPREAKEVEPELASVSRLSDNHQALWQAVRSRTAKGEPCSIAVIKDDLRATLGADKVRKSFPRWLDKLESERIIRIEGEKLYPVILD